MNKMLTQSPLIFYLQISKLNNLFLASLIKLQVFLLEDYVLVFAIPFRVLEFLTLLSLLPNVRRVSTKNMVSSCVSLLSPQYYYYSRSRLM